MQAFTVPDIEALNKAIPLLDLNSFGSIATNIEELKGYLSFYGFDELRSYASVEHFCGRYVSRVGDSKTMLFAHVLQQKGAAHTVLIAHGLFDHSGLFLHLMKVFLDEGFNVVALDLPGHGLSLGPRASIDDFTDYGHSISDLLSVLPSDLTASLSLVGQSTGCSGIMSCVSTLPYRVKSVVFLAPLVRPVHWKYISLALSMLQSVVPRVPRRFEPNSHDAKFTDFLQREDGLQYRYIEVTWIKALRKWVDHFNELPSCDIPTLILQGTGDTTVDWNYNINTIKRKYSCLTLKYFEAAKHHLANESDEFRLNVLDSSKRFIVAHLE